MSTSKAVWQVEVDTAHSGWSPIGATGPALSDLAKALGYMRLLRETVTPRTNIRIRNAKTGQVIML